MVYTSSNNKTSSKRRNLVILLIALLILFCIAVLSELTHTTHFIISEPTPTTTAKPVNSIDYSPASPTDNDETNQMKQNSTNPSPTPTNKPLTITLTRVSQDSTDKTLMVRVLVDGISSGTCTLELSQNGGVAKFSKQANIIQQNNIYTCSGFDIAQSEQPGLGEWTVKVIATNGSTSNSASQNIVLEK